MSHDIVELMIEVNEIELNNDGSVLVTACYLHNVFEQIHPFADGNGRVGRTLFN